MSGHETVELKVKPRAQGKHFSRGLRSENLIPAIVYGPKTENFNLSLSEVDVVRYNKISFENTIFTLKSDDKNLDGLKVLKKDVSIHPKSRRPVHVDFYAVDMAAEVRVHVEVKYVGKPEGVLSGGVVQEIRHEVEVECLPSDIPDAFELDITAMKLGDVLHASDIKLPSQVKLISTEDTALVSVVEPKKEEEAPAAAEGAASEAPASEPAKKD